MKYIIVDCYPQSGSADFRSYAGAAIGCWIRTDLYKDEKDAEAVTERKLNDIGWTIARTIHVEECTAEDYESKNEGREFFEQARIDGFVANLHVCTREIIGGVNVTEDIANSLDSIAGRIIANGGISFHSKQMSKWATGETSTGDLFVPLWINSDYAKSWVRNWPEYDLRDISVDELRADFLQRINEEDMWIGAGVTDSVLVLCHPIWLKNAIAIYST